MALTDVALKNLKAGEKIYRKTDSGGLYVEVHPNGSKYWRWKYRYADKERRLAIGVYPRVTLAEARTAVAEARKVLKEGLDPSTERRVKRAINVEQTLETFEAVMSDWLVKPGTRWSSSYRDKVTQTLKANVLPKIGGMPISRLTPPMVLECIRAIEARGAGEQAARALRWVKNICRYAVATGRVDRSPLSDVNGSDVLMGRTRKGFAHLEKDDLGEFLQALSEYRGRPETRIAVNLLLLTGVRTGELRHAQWCEFDFAAALWRIPAARMKMRAEHLVPLAPRSIELLEELQCLTGRSQYLFPGVGRRSAVISENTVNKAIALLGFKGRVVGHGFRATFSTIANESGKFAPDVIERQLAHKERNEVRAAYHRSTYIDERRRLMTWWANELDSLQCAGTGPRNSHAQSRDDKQGATLQ